jgi:hypothetical protein
VASGENAIIEGKIALIIDHSIKDNDCYIHLYYLSIYSGSSEEIDISHFQNPFGKKMIHSLVSYH